MDSSTICIIAGPVISFVVSILKRIPFIKNHTKATAMAISAILGSVVSITGSYHGISYSDIFQCILVQFAGAVATHEAVVQPIKDKIEENSDSTPSNPNDFGRPGSL